mmetsp:Transcript_117658/g.374900  ORF Transcript_117658/g.374900 Transcript_117658/m.374900 type:complete len:226 (+) Transcript_117658:988-1665(+)
MRVQNGVRGLLDEEVVHAMDTAIRVDLANALGHDLHLLPPDGARQRVQLPVRVAHADVVQVHERKCSDAAAGQGFDDPRSDATYAQDGRPRPAHARHGVAAEEKAHASEAERVEVRFVLRCRSAILLGRAGGKRRPTAAPLRLAQHGPCSGGRAKHRQRQLRMAPRTRRAGIGAALPRRGGSQQRTWRLEPGSHSSWARLQSEGRAEAEHGCQGCGIHWSLPSRQ